MTFNFRRTLMYLQRHTTLHLHYTSSVMSYSKFLRMYVYGIRMEHLGLLIPFQIVWASLMTFWRPLAY